MLKIIFWTSAGLIFYTYFGYPLLLLILSVFISKPVKKGKISPSVSMLISAYNEEKVIETKIKNYLALDYPKDKMELIIGSDGSTDKTNEILEKYMQQGIKFYIWKERRGKVSILNDLVPQARGEIIVFTDARQILDKNAIKELVNNFADTNVGCVSGELMLEVEGNNSVGEGIGFYWKYEKFLRKKESQIDSMLGATGAIYAIRKALYSSPPNDIILDDIFIPMKIVEQGYRAIFEPKAKAYDKVSQNSKEEFIRKVRTLTGNWQIFIGLSNVFNPFKNKIALQLFSHKFLRVVIPYFLAATFVSNMFLLSITIYKILFILQIIFYSFATIGSLSSRYKIKLFNIPYVFGMLNIAAVKGLFCFINNTQRVTWKK